MRIVQLHSNAAQDLRAIRATDSAGAAAVLVALEQIEADPNAIDKLTTHGNNDVGTARLNVKSWISARGYADLWRVRILDTPATVYRVVYCYEWHRRQICVLAIVHKDEFDYDDHDSKVACRIFADWRGICS